MEAEISSFQEEMRAEISLIWANLGETMQHRVEDVLVSLDHRTQAEIDAMKTIIDTMR